MNKQKNPMMKKLLMILDLLKSLVKILSFSFWLNLALVFWKVEEMT